MRSPSPARPPFVSSPRRRLRRWWASLWCPEREDSGETRRLRAEAALLRIAAEARVPGRLFAAVHRELGGTGATASLLLRAAAGDRGGWAVTEAAGSPVPPEVLAALPAPHAAADRPEPLLRLPAPLRQAWAAPLDPAGAGERAGERRLWILPNPLPGATEARSRRLAAALGRALAARLDEAETNRGHAAALALRDAQLALHAAAARAAAGGGSPSAALGSVLETLRTVCGANRAAVWVADGPERPVAVAGPRRTPGVEAVRHAHERRLCDALPEQPGVAGQFDPPALAWLGVDALIGRAAGVRVGRPGGSAGKRRPAAPRTAPFSLILSRRDRRPLAPHAVPTLAWAAGFLAETLARAATVAAASRAATRDPLTGLANRGAFDAALAALTAEADRDGGEVGLLMVDLDHFKAVNDTHGHQVGDRVLIAAADAIRGVLTELRSGDRALAARYGGEELAVLLPGFSPAGVERVAERVRNAIAACGGDAEGEALPSVTASLGAAALPCDAPDADGLLAAADAALYAAKHAGRNRVMRAAPRQAAAA